MRTLSFDVCEANVEIKPTKKNSMKIPNAEEGMVYAKEYVTQFIATILILGLKGQLITEISLKFLSPLL